MHRNSLYLVVFLLVGCISLAVAEESAQGSAPADSKKTVTNPALMAGIDAFGAERYRESLDHFASLLADPKAGELRPTASYWAILAYLALGDQAAAEKAIDSYLATYAEGERVPDLLYQKARLFYAKGDFESALTT